MTDDVRKNAEESIAEQHHTATAALSAGDLDSMMAVYADEVIMLPPNEPARVGTAAVRAMWEGVLDAFAVNVSVSVEEVEVLGAWAFERGTFEMKLTPRSGGSPLEDSGKYLDVLRRNADGDWKYWRLCFNSSLPPRS
ncbi:MAG: DUF4440 domain-containing protein [Gemmatimonadota bacterium]|nr:DUF4440 domain-containing protein [Gemmatimonadota bacterium]